MDGFFFVNKSVDWTSRDVCNKISHLFHEKKVGHIGTLDPFAEGLLIVTIGKGTKAGRFLNEEKKEYIAKIKLGKKTSSGDSTGKLIEEKAIPRLTKNEVNIVLNSFLGESEQIPPMTSAVHYQGHKLYELERKGITVERKKRKIIVYSIELLDSEEDFIRFKVTVSKGTYIRVLGEDIALKLNTYGYLDELIRTKIGIFSLQEAKKVEQINEKDIFSVYKILSKNMTTILVDEREEKKIKNGLNIILESQEKNVLLVNKNNEVLAVYSKINNNEYSCVRGLW